MSKIIKLIVAAGFAWAATGASAGVLTDTYIGSDNHNYGDVIGDSTYDIARAEVTKSGTVMTIKIVTNFAGHAGQDTFATPKGIGYGDLFLNSTWNPFGSDAGHVNDNASNGTKWGYGLALDNRWSNTGGTFTLYQLTGVNNAANVLNSETFLSCQLGSQCFYRNGQAVAVNTAAPTSINTHVTGSWKVDANKDIIFTLNVGATGLNTLSDIALHWGETCGNDVIEGKVHIPEPGSFALFGVGLAGLAALRRRRSA